MDRRRSAKRAVKPAKARKPVPQMSKRRQSDSREYARLRKAFLARAIFCERHNCVNPATCVHHWAGRRSNYLKVETWKASCHPCNQFAKEHPRLARAENWIAPVGVYLT